MKNGTPTGYYRNPVTGELKRKPDPSPFDVQARVWFAQHDQVRAVYNPVTGKPVKYY